MTARIRDLRKARFGGYDVDRKRSENHDGLWVYRLREPEPAGQRQLFAEVSA